MPAVDSDAVMTDDPMEGSPQRELFMIMLIIFLSVLLRNTVIPWIFLGKKFNTSASSYWLKFLLDFGFLVVPGLLCMTIFSSSLLILAIILIACLSTVLFFIVCEYITSHDRPPVRTVLNEIVTEHCGPTTFITYFRSTMLLLVGLAILAVDFPFFPTRYRKTERYGHSLMDIGVAAFIVAAAMGSRLKTSSMRDKKPYVRHRLFSFQWCMSLLRNSNVILTGIGLARTCVIYLLGYYQPVTEYGVHWNFFYTMAVVRVVSRSLPSKFPVLSALLFALLQQTVLMNGLEKWILFGENARDNLLLANIEGIASLMGYLSLHYASLFVAEQIAGTGVRIRSWLGCCVHLFILSGVFFVFQMISEYAIGPPSRRVANLTYVLSQLSLLVFAFGCFLVVQMFSMIAWAANAPHFALDDSPFGGVQPCLMDSVNNNALVFFMLANLFTGMVNLSLDTQSVDDVTAIFILVGYMLLICIVVHYRGYMKIKNKNT